MIVARRHRMILNKSSSRRRFLSSLLKRRSKMLTGDPSKKAHELGSAMSTTRGGSRAIGESSRRFFSSSFSKMLTGDSYKKKAHELGGSAMSTTRGCSRAIGESSRRFFSNSSSKMLTGDFSKKAHKPLRAMGESSRRFFSSLKRRSKKLTGDPSKKAHEPGSVEKMLATRSNLRAYVCILKDSQSLSHISFNKLDILKTTHLLDLQVTHLHQFKTGSDGRTRISKNP